MSTDVDVVDMAKVTFRKQTEPMDSANLSRDGTLAITGGHDGKANLWRVADGEILLECTGHTCSVIEACFSYNDQLVATGDEKGLIQVWNVAEAKLIWWFEVEYYLRFMLWHHMTNILITGCSNGDVYIFQVPLGICKALPAGNQREAQCAQLLPDGKRLLVGYQTCCVKLWDIITKSVLWEEMDRNSVTEPEGSDIINWWGLHSVTLNGDGTLAVFDPNGNVWDMSHGFYFTDVLTPGGKTVSCCFNSELEMLVTSEWNILCIWDTEKFEIRHQVKINRFISHKAFISKYKLVIAAEDGVVYVYDVRTGSLSEALTGHTKEICQMSVSKNAGIILTTSYDRTAKIFSIKSD